MVFGIDASNIREGGGLTHLKSILQFANPEQFGVSKIVIWSSQKTLNQLPNLSFVAQFHEFFPYKHQFEIVSYVKH